jgi:hypothetical protein
MEVGVAQPAPAAQVQVQKHVAEHCKTWAAHEVKVVQHKHLTNSGQWPFAVYRTLLGVQGPVQQQDQPAGQ